VFDPGDNLSNYPHIDFLKANSAEALQEALKLIRLPFRIITIYHDGKNHVAWVSPVRPLRKIIRKEKQNGNSNS
jgi:hypothetical protein